MKTLDETCLINDTIITFYLKFLERYFTTNTNNTHKKDKKKDIYCYNTHFYVFLQDQYQEQIEYCLNSYKKLEKWGKSVNVFGCRFIAIPIYENNHWSLIMIVNPGLIKQTFEEVRSNLDHSEGPSIIYFDSFFPENDACVRIIKRFLIMEFRRKEGSGAFDKEIDNEIIEKVENRISVHYPKVPGQQNTYDCGIYLLAYAELFFRNPEFVLNRLNLKVKLFV